MNQLYKVEAIVGKDLGCVAINDIKKGTIILQEKPQCTANASDPSELDVRSVINSFDKMSTVDQNEFLKLHNRFSEIDELLMNQKQKDLIKTMTNSNQTEMDKIVNIYGIYRTNGFETGVAIQFARHSALKLEKKCKKTLFAFSKMAKNQFLPLKKSENCIFGSFKLFSGAKMDFLHF